MLQFIINHNNQVAVGEVTKAVMTFGPTSDYDYVLEGVKNASFTLLLESKSFRVLPIDAKTVKTIKGKFNTELSQPEVFIGNDLYIIFIPMGRAKVETASTIKDWNFEKLPKCPTNERYPQELLDFLLGSVGVEQGGLFYKQNGVLKILGQKNLNLRSGSTLILNRFLEQNSKQAIIKLNFETHTMLFQAGLAHRNFILIRTILDKATEVILYVPEPEKENALPSGVLSTILCLASHGLSMHLAYQMNKLIFSRNTMEMEDDYYWGQSEVMQRIKRIADKLKETDLSILIQGETGTGKEGLAQYLAKGKKIVSLNCASIPHNLFESILFGHEKGSFTGAIKKQIGKIEEAHEGVLFLDEIAELPLDMQGKLLRFLQSGLVEPVGGKEKKVKVRVIAATHGDLSLMISKGKFREDLYFRINEANIKLPSLRERSCDIVPLAMFFLSDSIRRNNLLEKYFSKDAHIFLESRPWKGNIRELRSIVRRVALLSEKDIVDSLDLEQYMEGNLVVENEYPLDLNLAKKMLINNQVKRALQITKGNKTQAAKLLGITGRTFFRIISDDKTDNYDLDSDSDVTPVEINH